MRSDPIGTAHDQRAPARPFLTRVDAILLCMVLFWGANISIVKVALREFEPAVFNCLRFSVASISMLLLYRHVFRDHMEKRELFQMLLLGILGNTIYQFLFVYGVSLTFVTHTSILLATTPIFTAAISSLFGLEVVRSKLWLGILLSFTGVVFIVFGGEANHSFLHPNIGDIFIILASLVWSIYTTFSKEVIRNYSSQHYIVYTVLFGTLFLVPPSIPALAHQDWSRVSPSSWLAVGYSALLALVYGYSAWYYGVQKIGSTRTSAYSNLTPVIGVAVGMIFLGERLTLVQWAGALIIFLGLMINKLTQPEPVVTAPES
jgi:drug/metabolite transporter (DMT)-like permease